MNRFTARIALIAYLLGGWLLPSTHHHVRSHCGASVMGCCSDLGTAGCERSRIVALVSTEAIVAPAHVGCRCQAVSPIADAVSPIAQADSDLTSGHRTASCDGLCALCCATGLIDQVAAEVSFSLLFSANEKWVFGAGLDWPLSPFWDGVSSRGPPAV